MNARWPRSPYDREGGLVYFPRMVEKIRLHQRGELPADYHANLGAGFDRSCCDFLQVDHGALTARVACWRDRRGNSRVVFPKRPPSG